MSLSSALPGFARAEMRGHGYDGAMHLTIELERETDCRWIAEATELPGVMCYGKTRDEAICNAERPAIEVIAARRPSMKTSPSGWRRSSPTGMAWRWSRGRRSNGSVGP